jgi:hypothetical protein
MNSTSRQTQQIVKTTLAVLAGLSWLCFNLVTLTRYPSPGDDDAFFASIAANFMRTGHFGFPLYPDVYGSASSLVHIGHLYLLAFVPVFFLLGVGLFQARLVSLMGGLICATLVYRLGRRLWGPAEAVLAALFMLLSWQMFWSSHTTRPDTWIGAAGVGVLLLLRNLQAHPGRAAAFVLGLAVGGLLELHLKTMVYIVPIGIGLLIVFGRRRAGWPLLVSAAAGVMLSAAAWLAIHFLPDPALSWLQFRKGLFAELTRPSLDLAGFVNNVLLEGLLRSTRLGWLEATVFTSGLAGLALRRREGDIWSLTAAGLLTVSYVFLVPYKAADHFQLFRPLLSLTSAAGLIALSDWLRPLFHLSLPPAQALGLLAALPLLAGYIAGDAYLAFQNRAVSIENAIARMRSLVPPTASVLGEGLWWYAAPSGTFTSDLMLAKAYLLQASGGLPLDAYVGRILAERQVEYLLLDDRIGSLHFDPPTEGDSVYPAVVRFANVHCRAIGSVRGPLYGADIGGPEDRTTMVYQCP